MNSLLWVNSFVLFGIIPQKIRILLSFAFSILSTYYAWSIVLADRLFKLLKLQGLLYKRISVLLYGSLCSIVSER